MNKYHEIYNSAFLEQSQWWSKEKLRNLQLEGLKQLIKWAKQNTHYAPYVNAPEIKSLNDLKKFPVLTKELIHTHWNEILCPNVPNGYCITESGGTVSKVKVAGDLRLVPAQGAPRFIRWYPVPYIRRKCYFWGTYEAGPKPEIKRNNLWLPIEIFKDEKMGIDFLRRMASFKPDYLKAYALPLAQLSIIANKAGIHPEVGVIATHCETLTQGMRKEIEEAFISKFNNDEKIHVFNFYGARDLGEMAQDCEKHEGLHFFMERYILEVVDGRFLFTDLLNYASPLIRYENQDIGEWSNRKCSCGRGLSTLKPLVGRVFNYIISKKNTWIPTYTIHDVIMYQDWFYKTKYFTWLAQYQIRQRKEGKITILVKTWEGIKAPTDFSPHIKLLHKYVPSDEFDIEFEVVDKIPLSPSGKQRTVDTTLMREWK